MKDEKCHEKCVRNVRTKKDAAPEVTDEREGEKNSYIMYIRTRNFELSAK